MIKETKISISSNTLKAIRSIYHKPGKLIKFNREEFLARANKEWEQYLKENR